jgi:chromosome segregation ATPase
MFCFGLRPKVKHALYELAVYCTETVMLLRERLEDDHTLKRRITAQLERIETTMTTKAELQEAKDQLTKALGEITGEIGTLKEKIADLEAAVQNGEDVSALATEIKGIAQRLDDVVADATPEPTEPTETPDAGEGEDTLAGESQADHLDGQEQ